MYLLKCFVSKKRSKIWMYMLVIITWIILFNRIKISEDFNKLFLKVLYGKIYKIVKQISFFEYNFGVRLAGKTWSLKWVDWWLVHIAFWILSIGGHLEKFRFKRFGNCQTMNDVSAERSEAFFNCKDVFSWLQLSRLWALCVDFRKKLLSIVRF